MEFVKSGDRPNQGHGGIEPRSIRERRDSSRALDGGLDGHGRSVSSLHEAHGEKL